MKQYKNIQESLTHFTEEPKGAGNNTKRYKNPSLTSLKNQRVHETIQKIQESLTSLKFQWVHYQYKNIQNPSLTSLKNQWYMKQYKRYK